MKWNIGLLAVALVALALIGVPQQFAGKAQKLVADYRVDHTPVSIALQIDLEEPSEMAALTQVYDGAQYLSGTLNVYNQENPGVYTDAPTKEWLVTAGAIICRITDITLTGWSGPAPAPSPPPGTTMTFALSITAGELFANSSEAHEFVYFSGAGPYNITRSFEIMTMAQRVTREESHSPGTGRSSSPVYAKEVDYEDGFTALPNPFSFIGKFGSLDISGTQWWDFALLDWFPVVSPVTAIGLQLQQFTGVTGVTYADATLQWSAADLNFSGLKYESSPLRFEGDGSRVSVDLLAAFAGLPYAQHSVGVSRPYLKDFADFAVVDRDGELTDDLKIVGGFVADPRYPWTASCPKVTP